MTDRSIRMAAPTVRGLLDGRKTQTRRLAWRIESDPEAVPWPTVWQKVSPGDRLYVKEAHGLVTRAPGDAPYCVYRTADSSPREARIKWRAPHFMPRWASRITLVITGAKTEQVQNINEKDALAEGIDRARYETAVERAGAAGVATGSIARQIYAELWDTIHIKPGERWEDNPEIVALSFEIYQCNVSAMTELTDG